MKAAMAILISVKVDCRQRKLLGAEGLYYMMIKRSVH